MRKDIERPTKTAAILELLHDPATYEEMSQSVEFIETHISWIFLRDRFVYKLKKPVRFDFLNFSTPRLRHVRKPISGASATTATMQYSNPVRTPDR